MALKLDSVGVGSRATWERHIAMEECGNFLTIHCSDCVCERDSNYIYHTVWSESLSYGISHVPNACVCVYVYVCTCMHVHEWKAFLLAPKKHCSNSIMSVISMCEILTTCESLRYTLANPGYHDNSHNYRPWSKFRWHRAQRVFHKTTCETKHHFTGRPYSTTRNHKLNVHEFDKRNTVCEQNTIYSPATREQIRNFHLLSLCGIENNYEESEPLLLSTACW